jgi:hypothetical protein
MPTPCCCRNQCYGASHSEDFSTAIPSQWTLGQSGGSLSIDTGQLKYQWSGSDQFSLAACIKKSVFSGGAFAVTIESALYGSPVASEYDQGIFLETDAFEVFDWARRWNRNPPGIDTQDLLFRWPGHTTATYGSSFADGDVLKMIFTGSTANAIDTIDCYFNGTLIHTETPGSPVAIGTGGNVQVGVYLTGSNGLTTYSYFDYFDITV